MGNTIYTSEANPDEGEEQKAEIIVNLDILRSQTHHNGDEHDLKSKNDVD